MKNNFKYIIFSTIICASLCLVYISFIRNDKNSYTPHPLTFTVTAENTFSTLLYVSIDEKAILSANTKYPQIDIFSDIPDKFRYYCNLSFTLYLTEDEIKNDPFIYITYYKTKTGIRISLRDLCNGNYGRTDVSFGNVIENKLACAVSFEDKPIIWSSTSTSLPPKNFPVRIYPVSP
jgi:uncharacterized membrane protein